DLYDARYWESAYREIVEAPALLIHLQDELAQARRREAFWISVVVHLIVVLLLWNSPKLAGLMPRRAVVVMSPESNQKDLTYLELPPDEQKVSKRPNTNIISDKDRIATSHAPQIDRQELKKILDASRPGRPGAGLQAPQTQPAPAAPAAGQNPAPQPSAPPPPAPNQNQIAKLQTPPALTPKAAFGSGAMSPRSAIEQAARATASNRGGYGGDSGDYGALGQGRRPTKAMGPLEILSDTMGVDFGPYLQRVLHDVRMNWYNLLPESAAMKKGKVAIQFAILKDGTVAGMHYVASSGDVALDRGAYAGITASNPFPPLPNEFGGQYLELRFIFYYNPDPGEVQ